MSPTIRFTGSDGSSRSTLITVTQPTQGDTILWTGAKKIVQGVPQQAWYDVGFTGFVYETGWLPGLGGLPADHADRQFIFNSGHDFSNSYMGIYLDQAGPTAQPPLADWFDDAAWENVVLPAITWAANKARELGFKGLVFDQELYTPELSQPATYWKWDYPGNTRNEWDTRVMAHVRGMQVAEAVGDLPVVIYNFVWPGSQENLAQQAPAAQEIAQKQVYINWFNGLAAGGLNFRLADNDIYKDRRSGAATWPASINSQLASLQAAWPAHASRWDGFIWITNGPNAHNQVVAGEPVTAWDRHRQFGYTQFDRNNPTWVTDQVAASRAASPTLFVYAYNLVNNVAPYQGLL